MRLVVNKHTVGWFLFGAILTLLTAYVLSAFIGTIVFGLFFYYASRPLNRHLRRVIPSRNLSAALSLILVALPIIGLLAAIAITALREYNHFQHTYDISSITDLLAPYIDLTRYTDPDTILALDSLPTLIDHVFEYIQLFGVGALHFMVVIAMAFYLLRDDDRLSTWLYSFQGPTGLLNEYLTRVDQDFHNIFFGNILNAVFTGIIGAATYNTLDAFAPAALSIPYPTLLGLLAGVASLIPIIGMKIIYLPVTAYLTGVTLYTPETDAIWFPVTVFFVSMVIVDGIPDIFLRPYVSGGTLHMGLLMIAYILGPLLFGWYGLFLAPILLVITFHFATHVLPQLLAPHFYPADIGYRDPPNHP